MDTLYKSAWLDQVKRQVPLRFPGFLQYTVKRAHPLRNIFSGAILFRREIQPKKFLWLWWQPSPGVERYYNVYVGWSLGPDVLPHHGEHDRRLYSLKGPSRTFPAAALDLEHLEGKAAVFGILIASPWDQLLKVKAASPKREHVAAMQRACAEAQSLSDEQRLSAVTSSLGEVFGRLGAVLPRIESEFSDLTTSDV